VITLVVRIDPGSPDPDAIARAAECLRAGGLVAFPTETVYGLGAHALDRAAVRRIFDAKGRPSNDPLIVHVANVEAVATLTRAVPGEARALGERFWPGPLTLVLERSDRVPDEVTAGLDTVAVRIPSHPVARALLVAVGLPVAAPSANLFSRPSPTRASHVLDDLDGRIDMILDAGPTDLGVESTVLDLAHPPPTILRPGAITVEQLRAIIPNVVQHTASLAADTAMPSPGLLEKHYSPRAPLTLYEGDVAHALPSIAAAAGAAVAGGSRVGILAPHRELERIRALSPGFGAALQFENAGDDNAEVARRLYAALRSLDACGVDLILARSVSTHDGIAAAIHDRLRRAAAGRIVRV
jgi:L-threonylcarbamoyladenylate synthase